MLNGMEASGEGTRSDSDLKSCEREPIHLPGSIQPHGVLLALDATGQRILQASKNLDQLAGVSAAAALGRPLGEVLGRELAEVLQAELAGLPNVGPGAANSQTRPVFLRTVTVPATATVPGTSRQASRSYHAIAHRAGWAEGADAPQGGAGAAGAEGVLVLEFEAIAGESDGDTPVDLHALVDGFTLEIEAVDSIAEMSRIACETIRRITGFDRVLIYRFDEHWNGTVIGEAGSGRLPSYLDHRFPASDIPAQARELYRTNRLRIIPDAGYRPVAVLGGADRVAGQRLDMSFATLRSVSPVHVEYMRNMETAASMSVSILRGGELWGLISCHHQEPKTVPFLLRGACDLCARAFSLRLSALEHADAYEHRIRGRSAFSRLLGEMTDRGDFAAALAENSHDLLSLTGAEGAALVTEEGCWLSGATPSEPQIRELAQWLFANVGEEVFATDRLPSLFPAGDQYKDSACGLLAAAISKIHPSYVLWFRPEVIRTIRWGGDPRKPLGDSTAGVEPTRLHPRRSFETWRETVRDRAPQWTASELEAAAELRNAIVGTVLRKAEELAALNAELTHSNKELEAFSYSVSHDLRAPLRHIVGYAEMLREDNGDSLSPRGHRCLDTIIESSEYAGRLVDKLLSYSRLGRSQLQRTEVDMNLLVAEVQRDVLREAEGREIEWQLGELPPVSADLMMLRMAVRDLLSNAVKYTRHREPARIEVGYRETASEREFWIKDNGVGFNMEYADKLFGVFQRLHRWEDYEGTGIGLANVRRVIERHGGRTWAEGQEDRGATFHFSLPKVEPTPAS